MARPQRVGARGAAEPQNRRTVYVNPLGSSNSELYTRIMHAALTLSRRVDDIKRRTDERHRDFRGERVTIAPQ
jgi:hypothetical protein